ncbi:hypothetical protein BD626DRAFT_484981 [Schizophyllum amplum]|uniref:Uncharacterized protein n=1 Tax=Schizophyllum amplum TaxID=97359 RepID=A0A550CR09_9AGAR|nr:hypothetical protein BD626DRAFT_484981 [Auriculariopsis ampla]
MRNVEKGATFDVARAVVDAGLAPRVTQDKENPSAVDDTTQSITENELGDGQVALAASHVLEGVETPAAPNKAKALPADPTANPSPARPRLEVYRPHFADTVYKDASVSTSSDTAAACRRESLDEGSPPSEAKSPPSSADPDTAHAPSCRAVDEIEAAATDRARPSRGELEGDHPEEEQEEYEAQGYEDEPDEYEEQNEYPEEDGCAYEEEQYGEECDDEEYEEQEEYEEEDYAEQEELDGERREDEDYDEECEDEDCDEEYEYEVYETEGGEEEEIPVEQDDREEQEDAREQEDAQEQEETAESEAAPAPRDEPESAVTEEPPRSSSTTNASSTASGSQPLSVAGTSSVTAVPTEDDTSATKKATSTRSSSPAKSTPTSSNAALPTATESLHVTVKSSSTSSSAERPSEALAKTSTTPSTRASTAYATSAATITPAVDVESGARGSLMSKGDKYGVQSAKPDKRSARQDTPEEQARRDFRNSVSELLMRTDRAAKDVAELQRRTTAAKAPSAEASPASRNALTSSTHPSEPASLSTKVVPPASQPVLPQSKPTKTRHMDSGKEPSKRAPSPEPLKSARESWRCTPPPPKVNPAPELASQPEYGTATVLGRYSAPSRSRREKSRERPHSWGPDVVYAPSAGASTARAHGGSLQKESSWRSSYPLHVSTPTGRSSSNHSVAPAQDKRKIGSDTHCLLDLVSKPALYDGPGRVHVPSNNADSYVQHLMYRELLRSDRKRSINRDLSERTPASHESYPSGSSRDTQQSATWQSKKKCSNCRRDVWTYDEARKKACASCGTRRDQ